MGQNDKSNEFADWARARLDEMNAVVDAAESKLKTAVGDGQQQIAKTLSNMKQLRDNFENQAMQTRKGGEDAWNASRPVLESIWEKYEEAIGEWVKIAKNESDAFEARRRAHLGTWQTMLDQYSKQAQQTQAQYQDLLTTEIARASEQAEVAKKNLDNAATAGWSTMSQTLETSRSTFEKTAIHINEMFKKSR